MNIISLFDINKSVNECISIKSNWKDFSNYFMFLTINNGGCSKVSSGSLNVMFPSHYEDKISIIVELAGYDTQTFSRNDYVIGDTEEEVKSILLERFENERLVQLNPEEKDIYSASMD